MNNILFFTAVAMFFHIWGGGKIGTAVRQWLRFESQGEAVLTMFIGALIAFAPFILTVPAWLALNQPLALAFEVLVLVVAIAIPLWVPRRYRETVFGENTYLVWLGCGLLIIATYYFSANWEMGFAIAVFALLGGLVALRQGVTNVLKYHHRL